MMFYVVLSFFVLAYGLIPVLSYRFYPLPGWMLPVFLPVGALMVAFIVYARIKKISQSLRQIIPPMQAGNFSPQPKIPSFSGEIDQLLSGLATDILPKLNRFFLDLEYRVAGQSYGDQALTGTMNEVDMMIKGALEVIGDLSNSVGSLRREVQSVRQAVDSIQASIARVVVSMADQKKQVQTTYESASNTKGLLSALTSLARDKQKTGRSLGAETRNGVKQVKEISRYVSMITQKKAEILETVAVVNEVSERINLLGMNAAIEAAHAGEVGKGFAIVAEEIRKLAAMTGKHAAEIGEVLKEIDLSISAGQKASEAGEQALGKIEKEVESFIRAFESVAESIGGIADHSSLVGEKMESLLNLTESINSETQSVGRHSGQVKEILKTLDENADYNATKSKMALSRVSAITGLQKESLILCSLNFKNTKRIAGLIKNSGLRQPKKSDVHPLTFAPRHQQYKQKIRQVVLKMDPSLFPDPISGRECELGKWLKARQSEYPGLKKLFSDLEAEHDQFHELAKQAVENEATNEHFKAVDCFLRSEACVARIIEKLFVFYDGRSF